MVLTLTQAENALKDLINNLDSITIVAIDNIISNLTVVDNKAPEGAITHLFIGEYTDFSTPGGGVNLGLIDSDKIRIINHTDAAVFFLKVNWEFVKR